jgi:hypothetical protein
VLSPIRDCKRFLFSGRYYRLSDLCNSFLQQTAQPRPGAQQVAFIRRAAAGLFEIMSE